MTHTDELRAWAKGVYHCEAATELLIRGFGGRFARPGQPWIMRDPDFGRYWIDFTAIPDNAGALSGGERRFLDVVASIGEAVPVVLSDVLSGLDRGNVMLVLAAVSHASGSHEHSGMRVSEDGLSLVPDPRLTGALYPWPAIS
jgi:hypothetical protein